LVAVKGEVALDRLCVAKRIEMGLQFSCNPCPPGEGRIF
jgi:hypothetical protein